MAAAVLSYSAERFNALPSLGVASVAFAPRKTAVLPELIALISRAGLADVAGVALLHAHFSMHDDERLVQRGEVRPARTTARQAVGRLRSRHVQVPHHACALLAKRTHGDWGQRRLRTLSG